VGSLVGVGACGKVAVVKATVKRRLLEVLEMEAPGKLIAPESAMRPEVSAEFRLTDLAESGAFLEVLTGLAHMACR